MAKLLVHHGRTRILGYELRPGATLGRQRSCAVQVDDPLASREHLRFDQRGGSWWVEDLGSAHGTWLDDQKVDRCRLDPGDVLAVGQHLVLFEEGPLANEERQEGEAWRKRMSPPGTESTKAMPKITVEHLVHQALARGKAHLLADLGDGPKPMELQLSPTTVGYSPEHTVQLPRRPWFPPTLTLLRDARGRWFAQGKGRGLLVNGAPLTVRALDDGDTLSLLGDDLRFFVDLRRRSSGSLVSPMV